MNRTPREWFVFITGLAGVIAFVLLVRVVPVEPPAAVASLAFTKLCAEACGERECRGWVPASGGGIFFTCRKDLPLLTPDELVEQFGSELEPDAEETEL